MLKNLYSELKVGQSYNVKLVKSPNKRGKAQIATVKGLGLRRIGHEVVLKVDDSIKGMLVAVSHLLEVK